MLFDRYRKIVADEGENVAITFKDHQISYAKLDEIVNKLANSMMALGLDKGDAVVLLLPNVPHFIFAYLSILSLGAVIVPVSPSLSSDKIQQIIDSTEAKAIIYWEGFHERICNLLKQFEIVVILGEDVPPYAKKMTQLIAQGTYTDINVNLSASDTVLIQHTPGIENSFKTIALSYGNISFAVDKFADLAAARQTDVFGALLPLSSLLSQIFIVGAALVNGAKIVIYPAVTEKSVKKAVFEDMVTVLTGGPNVFDLLLLSATDQQAHEMRIAFTTGSPSTEALMNGFMEKFGVALRDVYGVTESTGIISGYGMGAEIKSGSVGCPLNGMDLLIVNEDGEKVEPGEIGEIIVRGPNVMKGYLNQKNEQTEAIRGGWFYTGDLGRLDEDRNLFFVDRKNDVILKSGFRIYPSEIESLLKEHPKVEKVCVIGLPHPTHKYEVKACVVLKSGENESAESLIEYCKQHAPVYKCPQIVKFYNTLPQSNLGKVMKRKLRQEN